MARIYSDCSTHEISLTIIGCGQWCIAKNGGGYTQTDVAKGLKVPCLFMITEVSIRCQKNPGGWYTAYTRVYPPNTPLAVVPQYSVINSVPRADDERPSCTLHSPPAWIGFSAPADRSNEMPPSPNFLVDEGDACGPERNALQWSN